MVKSETAVGKIKRYKNSIERFLSGENGQRFFNFAYSIGAAIVILGALFKILHVPYGDILLCVGMGTEVLMFVLTAFDRPGRDYRWEEVFPVLNTKNPEDRPQLGGYTSVPMARSGEVSTASVADEIEQLRATVASLNRVGTTLLENYKGMAEKPEEFAAGSAGYVEQMQTLNKNISALNTIYEIQLKSVSSQLDAIDNVNRGIKEISRMYESTAERSDMYIRETEQLAENMRRLNQVYEKMLTAMTVNMTK